MRYYTREERLRREQSKEKVFTLGLRIFCALVSGSILMIFVYLINGSGMTEWNEDADFRESGSMLMFAVFGLFLMTTLYAIWGERALPFIRRMFRK